MVDQEAHRIGSADWKMLSAVFILSVFPFAFTPIVPTIDFYNHLTRYYVLAHVNSDAFLQQYYAANWSILPNIGMDVIGVGIVSLAPPLVAGKILLILVCLVQYSGVIYFNRQLTGHLSLITALAAVPLLYSYIFFWGFANFLLGLGMTFWAAGWWLKMRTRPSVALPIACVAATAIFLTHGLAFALYGMLLGTLEVGIFLQGTRRRLVDLLKAAPPLVAQAVIPVILFQRASTSKAVDGLTNADESVRRLLEDGQLAQRFSELAIYRLQTMIRVAEGPAFWFDIVTLISTMAIFTALGLKGALRIPRLMWPAIVLGISLMIIVPPAMFGVGYVADRMPLFLALILVGSLSLRPSGSRFERLCVIALAALVTIRVCYIAVDWNRYRSDFERFQTVAKALPEGALVAGFNVQLGRDNDAEGRCAMYPPLLALLDGHATPLFAYATQQPLILKGSLANAVDSLPRSIGQTDAASYYSSYIAAANAEGYFHHLLICNSDRLKAPYPDGVKVAAASGRFTLIELSSEARN